MSEILKQLVHPCHITASGLFISIHYYLLTDKNMYVICITLDAKKYISARIFFLSENEFLVGTIH